LPTSGTSTQLPSPDGSEQGFDDLSVLHLPFDVRPGSPTCSEMSNDQYLQTDPGSLFDVVRRVRNRFASITGGEDRSPEPRTPVRRRHRYNNGVLFFLPAMFAQPQDLEIGASFSRAQGLGPGVPLMSRPYPREKQRYDEHYDRGEVYAEASPVELLTEGVTTLRSPKGTGHGAPHGHGHSQRR